MNIVSFGGGTNSTAMIIGMYLHKIPIDLILFADTGGEQPHTYEFIRVFNAWLDKHGLPKITPVFYTDKDGNRLTLEEECFRGYDAGETRRIQHAAAIDEVDKKYEKHYPLYEWGWDRAECVRVIERAGLPKPGKSSCYFCPSMKKKEIQALWENNPELFQRAVDMEHNAADSLTSIKGLGRKWSWESYHDEFIEAQEFEKAKLTFDDLFPEAPGGCLCGAPCGCYDG